MVDDGDEGHALLVARSESGWQVSLLPEELLSDLDGLIAELRQLPPLQQPIALVDIEDEFFVALRLTQAGDVRALLSDATAAEEYPLAEDVLDLLDIDPDSEPDGDEVWPVGDLGIFADLGMADLELGTILDDLDMYADEMLLAIAQRLGFADQYRAAVPAAPA